MSHIRLLVIALLALGPASAAAQFTTFIPPQNKVADSVKAVVAAGQKVQADSSATARLTNMKTWVDSAAGFAPVPASIADSLAANPVTTDTIALPNGARAPATASSLPLMLLAGGVLLVLGGLLLRRPRPARERA